MEDLRSRIERLREFAMVSEEEYRQACSYFGDEFRSLKPKGGQKGSPNESSANHFNRESFSGSRLESSRGSKTDDDSSFKDVMERIVEL